MPAVSESYIEKRIYLLRGHRILLDRDLAEFYGVETRVLNQAVRRNVERFPADFMFELTRDEIRDLSQIVISPTWRHARASLAFTEQGVAMLSGLLNGPRAISVNIGIMRAFVQLRRMIASHADLARKLNLLEKRYDAQFKTVFEAIRRLMRDEKPRRPRREMGYHTGLAQLKLPHSVNR